MSHSSHHNRKVALRYLAYFVFSMAILIGLYTRVLTFHNFVIFGSDQIRDAKVYALMKEGIWPTLGPIAPINDNLGFYLFPLYYYLTGIFTLNSNNLSSQLLINGLLAFLAIPLIALLVYRLLENIDQNYRVLLSSISALWFSILASDIVNANMAWNPSPILFFVFLFLLIVDKLNKLKNSADLLGNFSLWVLLGIVAAFLSSLHTWSMLTFLPIFIINCVYFSYVYIARKKRSNTIFPLIGIIYLIMFLSTYLISEINSNWINTRSLLTILDNTSITSGGVPFHVLVSRPFVNLLSMTERTYIIDPQLFFLGLPFLLFIISFAAFNFKGNKFLLGQILFSIFIYSIGISFYSGEIKSRYQILIWYLPLLLTILGLAYTPRNLYLKFIQLAYIIAFVLTSFYFNWIYTYNFMTRVYGNTRLINTDDMINILASLPSNSRICYPWGADYDYLLPLQFIDKYYTHQKHIFENNCAYSDYYLYLKNIPSQHPLYTTRRNSPRQYASKQKIMESASFTVFKLHS